MLLVGIFTKETTTANLSKYTEQQRMYSTFYLFMTHIIVCENVCNQLMCNKNYIVYLLSVSAEFNYIDLDCLLSRIDLGVLCALLSSAIKS